MTSYTTVLISDMVGRMDFPVRPAPLDRTFHRMGRSHPSAPETCSLTSVFEGHTSFYVAAFRFGTETGF